MMAEGRFASLPRSLHAHHTLGGGAAHPGVLSTALGASNNGVSSPRKLQASLTSSMDLLSSNSGWVSFPHLNLAKLLLGRELQRISVCASFLQPLSRPGRQLIRRSRCSLPASLITWNSASAQERRHQRRSWESHLGPQNQPHAAIPSWEHIGVSRAHPSTCDLPPGWERHWRLHKLQVDTSPTQAWIMFLDLSAGRLVLKAY